VYVVDAGPDGLLGNSNDVVITEVDVEAVAVDPEDPTFLGSEGVLYFLSGIDREIHRLDPVDGVFGNGNDVRTNFDISHLGPTDFEGMAAAPNRGTLYVAARTEEVIFEITTSGLLLREIEVPFSGFDFISGLALAPGSNNPSVPTLWFVDRAADEVNDGLLFEISVPSLDDPGSSNAAPVAVDDAAATSEDANVNISVLGNDSDADGDALTPVDVSDPANGTATVNPNATITYTPDPNFNGTDTFTYRASDGSATSTPATVTVTVDPVNDTPVAVNDSACSSEYVEF
jgi:hypothetical protein